jgi:hypothetical protein
MTMTLALTLTLTLTLTHQAPALSKDPQTAVDETFGGLLRSTVRAPCTWLG